MLGSFEFVSAHLQHARLLSLRLNCNIEAAIQHLDAICIANARNASDVAQLDAKM